MLVTRRSPITGKTHEMNLDISIEQIVNYQSGMMLQDAFPHLTEDEREFFKSGITPAEWELMFGPEDDECFDDGDDDNRPAV